MSSDIVAQGMTLLLDVSCKALLLGCMAGLSALLLCRASAALRHLLWLLTLGSLLCLPLLVGILPAWRTPALSPLIATELLSPPSSSEASASKATETVSVPAKTNSDVSPSASSLSPATTSRPTRTPPGWAGLLGLAWLSGVLFIGGKVACDLIRLMGLQRACRSVKEGVLAEALRATVGTLHLRRIPTLLLAPADRPIAPMTWGVWHSVVLLPAESANWSLERLESVLRHECAHIRRQDWLTLLFARLVCALYWFHPVAWMAARGLRVTCEQACDDAVLRSGVQPAEYAGHLLDVVRSLQTGGRSATSAVAIGQTSTLETRLRALLHRNYSRREVTRGLFTVTALPIAASVLTVARLPLFGKSASRRMEESNTGYQEPLGHAVLTGKVVGVDGHPVKDMIVLAMSVAKKDAPDRIRSGRTDSKGVYHIQKVEAGVYRLVIRPLALSDTIALPIENVRVAEEKTVTVPDLHLTKGEVVQGQVIDENEKPLEGVYVIPEGPAHPALPENWTPPHTKTDAEGRFTVYVAPGRIRFLAPRLLATKPDTDPASVSTTVRQGEPASVTLHLKRADSALGVATGRVIYEDGKPASGIRILAQENDKINQSENTLSPLLSWSEAVTGADGTYRLTGLGAISYNIATEEKSGSWVSAALEGVEPKPGVENAQPDLVLTPGAIVEGQVLAEGTNKPVQNIPIGSYGPHRPASSAMILNSVTDAEGRYRLRVAPGESRFYVALDGFTDISVNLTLKKGETYRHDFHIDASKIPQKLAR